MRTLYPRDVSTRPLRSPAAPPGLRWRWPRSAPVSVLVHGSRADSASRNQRTPMFPLAAAAALASLLSVTLALPPMACAGDSDPGSAQRTDTQLHAQLGARVQQALRQTEGRALRFEVIEVSDWRLGRDAAEFVLWGLLHDDTAPARMLRVESWIDRRSLQLGALDLQRFDEFQALESPFQR